MQKKHILVVGLKTLGLSIVKQLAKYNCEVLAIDRDMAKVEEADDYATHAMQIDVHDIEKIESISLNSFDVAIITIDAIEVNIMSALLFKERGIPLVIVKATNNIHKRILEKIGVDKIISPEEEMGIKLAKSIMNESVIDAINFSDDYSIIEINALQKWVGKSLSKLNLREEYGINILCIKNENQGLKISPQQNYIIKEKDVLVVIAENKILNESDLA